MQFLCHLQISAPADSFQTTNTAVPEFQQVSRLVSIHLSRAQTQHHYIRRCCRDMKEGDLPAGDLELAATLKLVTSREDGGRELDGLLGAFGELELSQTQQREDCSQVGMLSALQNWCKQILSPDTLQSD